MPTTHVFKLKCTSCGLHYVVYSWEKSWLEDHPGSFCPECGANHGKLAWQDTSQMEIFMLVPGSADLVAMS